MKANDIIMCQNHDCILNKKCHRHEAEPEEYYQSYASFSGGKDCEYFWDMGKGTPDETPNTNPEYPQVKTPKEEFIENVAPLLVYMCDKDIVDQWRTCECYAEIIWENFVKKSLRN